MSLVDVVMTVGERDQITDYDCRVLDALERLYPHSRSALRVGLLPRLETALKKDQAHYGTWIGRRPLVMTQCLAVDDPYEHMVVVLPVGSTWRAVNAGYMFVQDQITAVELGSLNQRDLNGVLRAFAHSHIVPLLDARQEFSRCPFDFTIAFDLMYTLHLAASSVRLGRGPLETAESIYLRVDSHETDAHSNRETRQLALLFKYRPLPR